MIDRAPILAATLLLAIHVAVVVGSAGEKVRRVDHRDRILEYEALRYEKRTRCSISPLELAVFRAHDGVEACMREWNARVPGDVAMTVTLSVTDGHAFNATVSGAAESPSLRMCVAEMIERAFYPPRSDVLDLAVEVTWFHSQLVLVPRVVGRPETTRNIDL